MGNAGSCSSNRAASVSRSAPISGRTGAGGIRFFLISPAEGLAPFPEAERSALEAASVAFAPDGSSSPFIVEIDTGEGVARRLRYDPFSSVVRTGK